MKFYLAQNLRIRRKRDKNLKFSTFLVEILPNAIVPAGNQSPEEIGLCNKLRERLQSQSGQGNDDSDSEASQSLICELTASDEEGFCLRIAKGPVTNALTELCGTGVTMQFVFSSFACHHTLVPNGNVSHASLRNIQSTEMELRAGRNYAFEDPYFLVDVNGIENALLLGYHFSGELTVIVNVDVGTETAFEGGDDHEVGVDIDVDPVIEDNDKMRIYKKMLKEEIGSDLVIISRSGKQVKAHKAVLLAHSDIFKAMFQSDLKGAKMDTIEMLDLNEEGVRALLAYLYYWEEEEANSKPEVAFEMFQAGHKYDIPELKNGMIKLLLAKSREWFDLEVALNLFVFVRKLEDCGDLKMKAVQVSKQNATDLKKSPFYVALFKEDPEAVMELCELFAT